MANEGQAIQGTPKTETTPNSNRGPTPTNGNPVEKAEKLLAELKAENDRRERILSEELKLQADRMLAGTAGGRVEAPQLTEEDLKKKEALDFWKGTPIEKAISKYG